MCTCLGKGSQVNALSDYLTTWVDAQGCLADDNDFINRSQIRLIAGAVCLLDVSVDCGVAVSRTARQGALDIAMAGRQRISQDRNDDLLVVIGRGKLGDPCQ